MAVELVAAAAVAGKPAARQVESERRVADRAAVVHRTGSAEAGHRREVGAFEVVVVGKRFAVAVAVAVVAAVVLFAVLNCPAHSYQLVRVITRPGRWRSPAAAR